MSKKRSRKLLNIAKRLKAQLRGVKQKSNRRKRALRDLNGKIESYVALADAAISDAARWRVEAEVWKERYLKLIEKENDVEQQ